MGDGLSKEFKEVPATLRGRWGRDRVYGGLTRNDMRYNLRRAARRSGMVALYSLVAPLDGTPNSLQLEGFYDTIERAIKRVHALDRDWAEREARAEYDRLMLWAR